MQKPDSLQGSLDLLVLTILARRPGLHGYAIMSAIKEISGAVLRVEEGSLYPACTGWKRPVGFARDGSPRTQDGAHGSTS